MEVCPYVYLMNNCTINWRLTTGTTEKIEGMIYHVVYHAMKASNNTQIIHKVHEQ